MTLHRRGFAADLCRSALFLLAATVIFVFNIFVLKIPESRFRAK